MEFGLEGAESEEVSGFPLEEVEVSEQPLERVSGKGLEWKECAVALGTAGRDSDKEVLQAVSRTRRPLESKEC